MKKLYKQAGVSIEENDYLIPHYRTISKTATRPEVINEIGTFSGLFKLKKYTNPVLVASTDGVGTKVMLAKQYNTLDTIGHDIVNHCVNDILTSGAEPLFFLDYLATNGLTKQQKLKIVQGIADACKKNNTALLGGETADMNDLYPKGEFDLAGTIVGVVEKNSLIDTKSIKPRDSILALPSNGLHTNGYSLARKALPKRLNNKDRTLLGEPLKQALMRPHPSYLNDLKPHLAVIKGIAHITGGGIEGNIRRILPKSTTAKIDKTTWNTPPIFQLIQKHGKVSDKEMLQVFNMGIGIAFIVSQKHRKQLMRKLPQCIEIGYID